MMILDYLPLFFMLITLFCGCFSVCLLFTGRFKISGIFGVIFIIMSIIMFIFAINSDERIYTTVDKINVDNCNVQIKVDKFSFADNIICDKDVCCSLSKTFGSCYQAKCMDKLEFKGKLYEREIEDVFG